MPSVSQGTSIKIVLRSVRLTVLVISRAAASEPVYPAAVETVLRQHCLSCHGGDKQASRHRDQIAHGCGSA
jgi:hypothetical protein